jgi:hypothetical protein
LAVVFAVVLAVAVVVVFAVVLAVASRYPEASASGLRGLAIIGL